MTRLPPKTPGARLAVVGRLVRSKRVDHAIRALSRLRRSVPDASLVVVGDGPERGELLRLADELRLREAVEFAGRVSEPEKTRLLADATILVSIAVREGWGLTVTEAARVGTPSVCYRIPGLRDSVVHGRTGILTDPSPDALADGAAALLAEPARYKQLREAAWRHSADPAGNGRVRPSQTSSTTSSVGEATRLSARCDLPDEVAETLAARLDGATVAFGVPTFNEGAGVHDTLDSLAAAAAECGITRFRVVLSDSSETAETVDAARAWSDRKANVELAIDRSARRRSLKEANNAILAATGADVLVIAVGDVIVPAASLAELLLALATEPRPAVAFGCSFPDPAAHGLRYRASAWQIRATWRLASLLPESYPRADGALWGAWRSFYAGYRFPVRTGSLHDDAELLRHLVEHGIPVRNAWRARALKIPSGTYEDFRRQTTRWTQVAGQRKRLRPELKAALLEGLSDPIGAACYAVYRARLAADAARHEPHSEYWEVTASAKRSPARAGCRSDRTSTSVPARMLRVGLIGLGYWGPNYARVVSELPDTSLAVACDASADATELIRIRNPATRMTTEPADVFDANDVDAVIVATPTSTHFELSLAALESGKHVLCEKPLASTVAECDELVAAADRVDRTLFVGHTFIYNPAVRHLRALVESGEVGRVLYCHAARTGLGPIRQDVNALWDLAPHDLAILFYVFGASRSQPRATGRRSSARGSRTSSSSSSVRRRGDRRHPPVVARSLQGPSRDGRG